MSVHVHAKRAACLLAAPCVVRLLMRHGTGVVPLRSSTAGTDLVPVFADHSILYSTAVLGRYTTLIRREGSARLNAASRSIQARAAVCTVLAILRDRTQSCCQGSEGVRHLPGDDTEIGRPPRVNGAHLHSVYTYRLLPTHAAEAVTICRRRTGWQLARRAGDARRPPQGTPQRGRGRLRSA